MIDVANHAGVSLKSVSRVLNNEPHVQEKLRTKVMKSVRELGYVPSASARSLRSLRSYCINIVSHSMSSSFVHAVQFGALRVCQSSGYRMSVSMLDVSKAKDSSYLGDWCDEIVRTDKPDGVILMPPFSENPKINEVISDRGVFIARIGPNDIEDDNATILIDDRAAACEIMEHLISLGHRRIGFVRGRENQGATHQRFMGYRDALASADIDFDQSLVMPGQFNFESGLAAGDNFLDMKKRPTAVFAANDDMAAGVLVAAHRRSISVPDSLSIVGFDDSEIAKKMWPALTTIRQPLLDLGARAMEVLIRKAGKKGDAKSGWVERLNYELVVRQSSAPNAN